MQQPHAQSDAELFRIVELRGSAFSDLRLDVADDADAHVSLHP
jgi:hypothetical protein